MLGVVFDFEFRLDARHARESTAGPPGAGMRTFRPGRQRLFQTGLCLPGWRAAASDLAHQHQYHDDDDDQPDGARGPIAPTSAGAMQEMHQ